MYRRLSTTLASLVLVGACGGAVAGGDGPVADLRVAAGADLAPHDGASGVPDLAAADLTVPEGGALPTPDGGPPPGPGRGFPALGPWVSYYGSDGPVSVAKVASSFRIINLDADPGFANFTDAEIQQLRAGGQNRVISYLNLGACEDNRGYWTTVPSGFVSCGANVAAQLGPYGGFAHETWMNLGDPAYQKLIVDYVAPRLAARGVDGFFFDNLELVEHGTDTTDGPCDAACSQGGLDLVRKLRAKFPAHLFVMQNASSDVTRLGTTGGVAFPALLDGITREEVYSPYDAEMEAELLGWATMGLKPGGRPFWVATEDYVGTCSNVGGAQAIYAKSKAKSFSPYCSDASGGQNVICYWPF